MLNNFSLLTQFLNCLIEHLFLIIPNSSTGCSYNSKALLNCKLVGTKVKIFAKNTNNEIVKFLHLISF